MYGAGRFIAENYLGDVASVLSLIIVVAGFAITLIALSRSKGAMNRAEQAILQVRQDTLRSKVLGEFAAALTSMDEIKRLHRQEAWELVPERYSALRKSLISIRATHPNLQTHQKVDLQRAVQQVAGLERRVERFLNSSEPSPDIAKFNHMVSTQIDRLQATFVEILDETGR